MEPNGVIQRKLALMDKYITELETRTSKLSREAFWED
jgi:hypothetical protein